MYTYYRNAEACYAYLSDVPANLDHEAIIDALRRSKWFTRGWTLQELLAPYVLYFLDRNWKSIGSKRELGDVLSEITGIKNVANVQPPKISVATRMSWASRRECTREEDNAYCLMGIFGINMPLLYGEGENAFRRLQLEILKTSDDESLFAWWSPQANFMAQTGLLAASPHDFRNSADISSYPFFADRAPYDMTNKGLRIEAFLIPCNCIPKTEKDTSSSPSSTNRRAFAMTYTYQFDGTLRRLRGHGHRPLPYLPSDPAQESRTWIFPLNCRVWPNARPVVLILADWSTKSGQCCRLYSERSADESFGPEWNDLANWRLFAGVTRLTYIREMDVNARWILEKKSITPGSVDGASTQHLYGEDVYSSKFGTDLREL